MRQNCNFLEGFLKTHYFHTPVIEIVRMDDWKAKNLKPIANDIFRKVSEKFPDLKIYGMTFENETYNLPFPFGDLSGYHIHIDKNYDLKELKKHCMALELDSNGERFCDIDIYLGFYEKISRKDLIQ